MSEIELYQALHNLGKIQKKERLSNLQISVLATAAGMGDKKAHGQVKKIVKEGEKEDKQEQLRKRVEHGTARKLATPLLDLATINKLSEEADNGRQRKRIIDTPSIEGRTK